MHQNNDTNTYVQFDRHSGEILSCRCSDKPLGEDFLLIEWELGKNFLEANERMSDYTVIKEKQNYQIRKKNRLLAHGYDEVTAGKKHNRTDSIANVNVYKILENKNNVDIKISLHRNKKTLHFQASEDFQNFLIGNRNTTTNFHTFYLVVKDDFVKLLQIIKIDLNNFLKDINYVCSIPDTIENDVDIYCRKRFTYSLERINE